MGTAKKQRREERGAAGTGQSRYVAPPPRSPWVQYATLGGVAAVLALNLANARDAGRIDESLDDRLGKIESRIGQLATKVDKLPAQAQRPRRGPDPNKAYTIKTAGSPAKGPASAAVTIAEFSDFQ